MASSPQKKKLVDAFSDELTISRSGRVRKPKVFYDPSVEAKRRSLPNLEPPKPKKVAKVVTIDSEIDQQPKFDASPIAASNLQSLHIETENPENVVIKQEKTKRDPIIAAAINIRRKTIGVVPVFDGENGCIVCSRSDIKKGRFVNCTDCDKRGHFTCLRNEKLFRTADQEHNWQCSTCKICESCQKNKPNVSINAFVTSIKILWKFFSFH